MLQQPNYTQVPNAFFDGDMAKIHPSATAVFLAICRKTIGWHKVTDAISISQLCFLTGLAPDTTRKAVQELIANELVTVDRVEGGASYFTINMDPSEKTGGGGYGKTIGDPLGKTIGTKESVKKESPPTPLKGEAPTRRTVSVPPITYNFSESLWYGIDDAQVQLWGEAYPAVDVDLELRQMGEWCKSNGAKGRKVNWRRFVVNWLKRAQDRGGSQPSRGRR
jgi:hypothetical protein